ncbi:hypothetical protein HRbin39_01827 [bacterium HR39]|nr:hypothetical protein HRbin39_01827 [bacterium HR39]
MPARSGARTRRAYRRFPRPCRRALARPPDPDGPPAGRDAGPYASRRTGDHRGAHARTPARHGFGQGGRTGGPRPRRERMPRSARIQRAGRLPCRNAGPGDGRRGSATERPRRGSAAAGVRDFTAPLAGSGRMEDHARAGPGLRPPEFRNAAGRPRGRLRVGRGGALRRARRGTGAGFGMGLDRGAARCGCVPARARTAAAQPGGPRRRGDPVDLQTPSRRPRAPGTSRSTSHASRRPIPEARPGMRESGGVRSVQRLSGARRGSSGVRVRIHPLPARAGCASLKANSPDRAPCATCSSSASSWASLRWRCCARTWGCCATTGCRS